ncbi:MAG: cell division protein FtsQ [Nocardioidaceae bacterium]|nr:cell division protein FtsQ [Nocardioidaceae bacterium]
MSLFTRSPRSADPEVDGGDADERTLRIARRRFVRRQWARRWLAWRRVLVTALVLGAVVGTVWLVFFSTVLAVSGVQVKGVDVLSPAAVRRAAAVPTGAPLATVDLGAVTRRVERLPAVRSADVSRAWPDRVRVDVTERTAVAVVAPAQPGGHVRGIDADGVVFRRFTKRPADLPVIRRGPHADADALAQAAQVAGSLTPSLAAKVDFVRVRTVDRITLELRGGRTVLWGSAQDSAEKARVLAVLPRKASFYDVSVPGQPVIRK